jgi:hypothetical protein
MKEINFKPIGTIRTPYVIKVDLSVIPQFDSLDVTKIEWLKDVIHDLPNKKDDGRFVEQEEWKCGRM